VALFRLKIDGFNGIYILAADDKAKNSLKEVKRFCKEFRFTTGMLKGGLAKGG